ncbi:glycoside hydrolase family 78 protein [Jackrogersella minutella]|nr:glycoside hydrolase family 78 protein [Jackrogersella minutella]
MAVAISQVFFEHHRVALGIGETNPRISWRFQGNSTDWTQAGYSIEVSQSKPSQVGLFHYNSSESVLVPWPTVSFESAESATVRVRAYGQGDQHDTSWSDPVSVEAGLLTQDVWSGAIMIGAERETEQDAPHQPLLFRKEFSVENKIEKARLYVTAFGLYEASINGQKVGTAVLAPGWQSYQHRQVYDTYDVTDLLASGDNVLGIHVGEGWYAGRLGFGSGERNIWGDSLGALALLVISSSNETQVVRTDTTWNASTGAIITSEIYNGEVYDSKLEQIGWSSPNFQVPESAAEWTGVKELETPYGQLTAPDGPPIRPVEEVKLQEVLTSPTGKKILDFGQNLVGYLRLRVEGPEGATIELKHVEVLQGEEISTRPLRNASQTDRITLSGQGVQTWEPTFTYHGFRYVQVDGWPDDSPLDENSVTAIVIHSDMQETGFFECSDELITRLHKNILWSMKGNFMSVPTDCPQRDERLGWTGDAHAFAPTAGFLYDTSGFWRGWMKDVQSEQVQGVPPLVIPTIPGPGIPLAAAIWGDAVIGIPFSTYISSGDLDALREQFSGATDWLDNGIPRDETGLWSRQSFQLGDWLDPKAPPDDAGQATTSSIFVADAYLIYVTQLVVQMASDLGFEEEKSRYEEMVANLKVAFREAWISPDGKVANETQTGLTLPLYFELFQDDDEAGAAASRLQEIIAANDYLVGTGFAGTHLLGLALTKYNLTDTFYRMLLQTTLPSWLFAITMGATTTWERWDSLQADGSLNPGDMLSFNHYAVGSVGRWIYQVIGGLAPVTPGWKTAKINVIPGGNITWAKTSFLSPYGKFSTDWKVNETGFHMTLEIPPNANADVILPGTKETRRLGSGSYEISDPEFRFE